MIAKTAYQFHNNAAKAWERIVKQSGNDPSAKHNAMCFRAAADALKGIAVTHVDLDGANRYGCWKSYNPDDLGTLTDALTALGQQLANTVHDHGKAHDLEWIVKDWKGYVKKDITHPDPPKLETGHTVTIGWKGTFFEDKPDGR